ncbi:hypothetical protein Rsub_00599 [Raphidocelis subcapitata]|uniref:SGNH hydrolase-type esterase domain-containing protein n=1 Tax=Raphidocelis subcapitata TaxID=307507 RepID=A0A2V0NSI4_9CHLO|nr:hypothetical protein Rsub_00599 [Raphidocelis subcapitata]|eukprot:GBF87887.1 hypothetical protein Rsub_00599 [Raphidocelis subcapitata]
MARPRARAPALPLLAALLLVVSGAAARAVVLGEAGPALAEAAVRARTARAVLRAPEPAGDDEGSSSGSGDGEYDGEGGGEGLDEDDFDPAEHQPWRSLDRLRVVRVNGTGLGDALQGLLNHNFSLARPQLQRGLSYLGPHPRLRRLVARMLAGGGGPVRVGAVGGSISYGHGASQLGVTDWFARLGNWLPRAFPRAKFEFHNGCVPATPAAFMTLCLEHYLDPLADLVFVEYVLNDGIEDRVMHNRRVRIYERLLRRIMDQPHAPAVVLVGTHGMFRDRGAVGVTGESEWRPFHHTLEDLYGAVAAYYSAPVLSFRNAIYNLGQARRYNFRAFMREDFIHPNDAGHQAIADLAMHLLQEATVGLQLWPLSPDDEAAALGKLPGPMYPGNHPSLRRVCFHGDDFRSTVVNAGGGWEWVNEGTEASPKWGYVSTKPGAVLRVRLDTSLASVDPGAFMSAPVAFGGSGGGGGASGGGDGGSKQRGPGHTAVVIFSYLKSYENMGKAAFRCESGCSCKPRLADGATDVPESTVYFVQLHATPGRNCTLLVINDSGEAKDTKFKITGVMVNMVNEATREINDLDFAEDWPQYGVWGVPPLHSKEGLRSIDGGAAATAAAGAAAARGPKANGRLKARGRLGGGHSHGPSL